MLPINLYLVRHGRSESNFAYEVSCAGNGDRLAGKFAKQHTADSRLVGIGREQAVAAGNWFTENEVTIDCCYVSEYVRALETAALLGLPNAKWFVDPQLRERDYGLLEHVPDAVCRQQYPRYFELEAQNKFYTACPGGESMADVCNRIRNNVLSTLHREMADKSSVLVVCHGDIIEGFRVILERIPARMYNELKKDGTKWFRVGNGQIVHYTRRNPENQKDVLPYMGWVRSFNPYDPDYAGHDWREIKRKTYTNEELLEIVNCYPRLINNE